MSELRKRKRNRLQGYDYSRNGAYFVTICTKIWRELLGRVTVGASGARPPSPFTELSPIGKIVEEEINTMQTLRANVSVDCYVIMPNHVHIILLINSNAAQEGAPGRATLAPTVSEVIRQWKGAITKRVGSAIWQKSFHDHIIRNESDYQRIADYIESNPALWKDDCYYPQENG